MEKVRNLINKVLDKSLEYRVGAAMIAQSSMSQLTGFFQDFPPFMEAYKCITHDGVPGRLILKTAIGYYVCCKLLQGAATYVQRNKSFDPSR